MYGWEHCRFWSVVSDSNCPSYITLFRCRIPLTATPAGPRLPPFTLRVPPCCRVRRPRRRPHANKNQAGRRYRACRVWPWRAEAVEPAHHGARAAVRRGRPDLQPTQVHADGRGVCQWVGSRGAQKRSARRVHLRVRGGAEPAGRPLVHSAAGGGSHDTPA